MGLVAGKSGGNKSLASKPNLLSALRVQTSSYGQVLPIVYGQNRLAGRLLWSGDFTAIPHTSTQKVGGKGLGSGGGNAISNTTYTYQSAVAIALCQGPIQNLHNVWDTKGKLTLLTTSTQFTVPGGGGSFNPPNDGRIFHSSRAVSRADAFTLGGVNDFGSDGPLTLSGTQQTPMSPTSGTPAAGQYTVDPFIGTHTFSAADAGKVVTVTYSYSFPDSNSNGQPQQKLNITLFPGPRPQTPWAYLTSKHAGQDLGYSGVAYIASPNMDLGESGTLPNLSFEVLGFLPFGAGITDAEPSTIIADLLSSPYYGLAGAVPLDSANTLAQYRNFCAANGIFLSPVLDAQKPAAEWIQDILSITNAAAVWSEGLLKIVPYGDTTAFGNGAVFIPNTAPIYDLTTNDLLSEVLVKRPSVAEVKNSVSVEFVNRANDYNVEIAEDKDEAAIALYGLQKAAAVQAHMITTATVARFAANLLRKRSIEVRATFSFKLGWQFNLLEPMDLVTLTVPELGYNKKPVRITAIREDDSGTLEIDAEDFPWSSATPTLYAQQIPGGFVPQANGDPGSVNAPIIFEANDRLSLTGNYEIWIGVCGSSPDWGGCSVWLSPDGNNYAQVGRIFGSTRMGILTASLPAGSDPDTTHTASVDLSQSSGVLSSGTQADCDSFRTLCYLDGELISYQDATLTGPSAYTLGTRLRRGVWGSPISAHSAGAPFLRLDDAVFVYEADPTLIGTTLHFKFTSFNRFGLMEQSLANAAVSTFSFSGMFGNIGDIPANNATVDSVFVSGTAVNLRVYGPGGPTSAYSVWKRDQTFRLIPAATLTIVQETGAAPQVSTPYWVTYDFGSGAHRVWFNYNDYIQAVGRGQMRVGSLTTVDAAGTGGSSGGGGTGGGGGGGGGRINLL